jgi:hypothetical protein
MVQVLALLSVVAIMLAPFAFVAVLSAAFPRLRRQIRAFPRTDALVARFFDGTAAAVRPTDHEPGSHLYRH